ncbi:MAG: acyl-CoA-binding protein, partial [Planctomycetota bacterium]
MSLTEKFEEAQGRAKQLPPQSNETLLEMYSLYKQATAGDVSGKKPGMLDIKARAKYDAWVK